MYSIRFSASLIACANLISTQSPQSVFAHRIPTNATQRRAPALTDEAEVPFFKELFRTLNIDEVKSINFSFRALDDEMSISPIYPFTQSPSFAIATTPLVAHKSTHTPRHVESITERVAVAATAMSRKGVGGRLYPEGEVKEKSLRS